MRKLLGLIFMFVLILAISASSFSICAASDDHPRQTDHFISGRLSEPSALAAEDVFFNYVDNGSKLKLNARARESFQLIRKEKRFNGGTFLKYQQLYNGIPVFGHMVKVHVDQDGVLRTVSGKIRPELDKQYQLARKYTFTPDDAINFAKSDLTYNPRLIREPETCLVVFIKNDTAHYAYTVKLAYDTPEPGRWQYFIDALTGEILEKDNCLKSDDPVICNGRGYFGDLKYFNATYSTMDQRYLLKDTTRSSAIQTFDAKNSEDSRNFELYYSYNGAFDTWYDGPLVDAHYYTEMTIDYYQNNFNRNGWDNHGRDIKVVAHYGMNHGNAHWDGTQLLFGDGTAYLYPLSAAVDVVGHEFTHAVTESEANLPYHNQSGAIDEAYSDIFGTLIEYSINKSPDWLIAEDATTSGRGIRSLSDPTQFGCPDHFWNYNYTNDDNGGVHSNSGIINKAAYLISEGGTHYGITVNGIGRQKLGTILYYALCWYLPYFFCDFNDLYLASLNAASDLYGANSMEWTTVRDAFWAVGIGLPTTSITSMYGMTVTKDVMPVNSAVYWKCDLAGAFSGGNFKITEIINSTSTTIVNVTTLTANSGSFTAKPGAIYRMSANGGGYYSGGTGPNYGVASGSISNDNAHDNIAPNILITAPVAGSRVRGVVTLTDTATDGAGIARVELYIDGNYSTSSSTAPYSFNINTVSLTDGDHTFKVMAYDQAGNTGENQQTISVDNTNPNVSIVSPTNGNTVNGPVTIQANASDNYQIDRVELYVKGALVVTNTAAPYQTTWDSTWLSNGAYAIKAIAYDKTGNSSSTPDTTVNVNHAIYSITSMYGMTVTKDVTPVNSTVYWKCNLTGAFSGGNFKITEIINSTSTTIVNITTPTTNSGSFTAKPGAKYRMSANGGGYYSGGTSPNYGVAIGSISNSNVQ